MSERKILYNIEAIDNTDQAFKEVEKDAKGVEKKLKTTAKKISKSFNTSSKNMSKSFRDGIKNMSSSLATFAAKAAKIGIAVGGALAAGIAAGVFKATASIEEMNAQWSAILGNAEAAARQVQALMEFASRTPFQVEQLSDAAKILQTLTAGALNTKEGLTLVGDAAATSGAEIASLALHVGRLKSAWDSGARADAESINRLTELGIVSGKAKRELKSLQDQAKFNDAWILLQSELKKTEGGMEKLSKTINGKLSTIKDLVSLSFAQLGEGLNFKELFGGALDKLIKLLNNLKNSGVFFAIGQKLSILVVEFLTFVEQAKFAYKNLTDFIIKWTEKYFEFIMDKYHLLHTLFQQIPADGVIKAFKKTSESAKKEFKDTADKINEILNFYKVNVIKIVQATSAFGEKKGYLEKLSVGELRAFNMIQDLLTDLELKMFKVTGQAIELRLSTIFGQNVGIDAIALSTFDQLKEKLIASGTSIDEVKNKLVESGDEGAAATIKHLEVLEALDKKRDQILSKKFVAQSGSFAGGDSGGGGGGGGDTSSGKLAGGSAKILAQFENLRLELMGNGAVKRRALLEIQEAAKLEIIRVALEKGTLLESDAAKASKAIGLWKQGQLDQIEDDILTNKEAKWQEELGKQLSFLGEWNSNFSSILGNTGDEVVDALGLSFTNLNSLALDNMTAIMDKSIEMKDVMLLVGESIIEVNNAIAGVMGVNSEKRIEAMEKEKTALKDQFDSDKIALSQRRISQRRFNRELVRLEAEKAKKEAEIAKKQEEEKRKATRANLVLQLLSAIANTAMGVSAALALGPPQGIVLAAITGALGALSVGVIASQLSKFADGGVVGGNSYSGDQQTVRVNSGELILNRSQQAELYAMAKGQGGSSNREPTNIVINQTLNGGVDRDMVDEANASQLESLRNMLEQMNFNGSLAPIVQNAL